MLFSEPKIPQYNYDYNTDSEDVVSVLFSEPKIPQSWLARGDVQLLNGFSALQRAENSSIVTIGLAFRAWLVMFQCSSASRKFLNTSDPSQDTSSPEFQCSSASRKFLNFTWAQVASLQSLGFSALQRAENSSITGNNRASGAAGNVSVLFSEPKIPQS